MASNKNQHFVPRCYLAPFTSEVAGRAINLFNLDRSRAVRGAPVKGQCSGDYFYGEDLVLERAMQQFEGQYASRLRAMLAAGYILAAEDAAILRRFWLLQYLRTEAASLRFVQMTVQMDQELGGLPEDYKLTIKEAVQNTMRVFFSVPDVVSDLKVRLVRNCTARPFITSDNPAVMTNRWHLTDPRARGSAPGLQNAGMIGMLPLSPNVMCVLYDGGLYSVPHIGGWADLRTEADADAFNEHQVLSCEANLYFSAWDWQEQLAAYVGSVASRRPEARHVIEHLVLDREEPGGRVYRPASAAEAMGKEGMVHTSIVTPSVSKWPSLIRWRQGGFAYDSHSGAGFMRQATRDPGISYGRLRIRG